MDQDNLARRQQDSPPHSGSGLASCVGSCQQSGDAGRRADPPYYLETEEGRDAFEAEGSGPKNMSLDVGLRECLLLGLTWS